MLRMLLPPLRPSRGCGTSRLGRPHCAGARPGSASCLGTRGAGPFGTCSLPRARRWGRAGALLRELETCPEPAPGVAVGAARAHKRRGARGTAGGSKAARLSRSPQSWGPDPHSHAPGSGLSASPPCGEPGKQSPRATAATAGEAPRPGRSGCGPWPTRGTCSGWEEGQPGPAERLTPFPRATRGPRAGCSPGVARRASGPRTRRPVTVRRLTRTRARPLTKVYFVSSKGAKGSASRRPPGAGGSVSGRVARAPPGGRGVRVRRRVHANGVPSRPGPPAPAWPGLQGSLRGKRLVWLLNCFPARWARKSTIPSANKRVQMNKNASRII